jgi:predicted acylesterase/phospholipase RssA
MLAINSVTGAALGSIIASIITAHMTKMTRP